MLNNGLKSIHTKVGKMTTSKKMARGGEQDFLSGDNLDSPRLSANEMMNALNSRRNGANGFSATGKTSGMKWKTMTGRLNQTE
jgi:hypothetical protein